MSSNGFRKRILVTEGDLLKLYAEVQEVRNQEQKQQFKADFKQLLKDAQLVSLRAQRKEPREPKLPTPQATKGGLQHG